MKLARGARANASAGIVLGKGATTLATVISDENQAVIAPAPGPTTVTPPSAFTDSTVSSVEVNHAQRVTSRLVPSS
jgi:hypothetical protein